LFRRERGGARFSPKKGGGGTMRYGRGSSWVVGSPCHYPAMNESSHDETPQRKRTKGDGQRATVLS